MLIQKCPYRHTQNNAGPNIWAPCSPVKLTHKINHLRILFLLNGGRKIKSLSVLPVISFNVSYFPFQIITKKCLTSSTKYTKVPNHKMRYLSLLCIIILIFIFIRDCLGVFLILLMKIPLVLCGDILITLCRITSKCVDPLVIF